MNSALFCAETEVPKDKLIVSHTDLDGVITMVNDTFADISGYDIDELIGKKHNIIRHPDMPSSLFANLWRTLLDGKMWSGYVKNLRKDGGYYWVYAQVSQLYDKNSQLIGYKSLRAPVELSKRRELDIGYAKMKLSEENIIKLSVWLDTNAMKKLENLSLNKDMPIAKVLEHIILGED